MRIGLVIDISDTYYQVKRIYGPKNRLNFKSYYDYISNLGTISSATGFVSNIKDNNYFVKRLNEIGIECKVHKSKIYNDKVQRSNCNVAICMKVIELLEDEYIDTIILGTADSDFIPLVKYIKSKGRKVFIFGVNVSPDLKGIADETFNIFRSMIQER